MSDVVDLQSAPNGVTTITLCNGKVNALSVEVLRGLAAAATTIREATGPERPRVVVVTGGPKLFAAGADISEFAADASQEQFALSGRERVREIGSAFLVTMNAIAALPMPTLASISGYALGGGLELALACDLRIASTKAKFGLPEILLGIIPGGGGTQRLPRLVGPGIAKDLIFTGRQVDSSEALRIGLVNEVVEPDQLETRTNALAEQLAAGAPNSLVAAKAAIDGGLEGSLDAGMRLEQKRFVPTFSTRDAQIGVKSFLAAGPGHADFTAIP